jgi:hypothetical protein
MSHRHLALLTTACALLALPAAASARPANGGFATTYPHAAALCAKAAAGTTPKRLASSAAEVRAACDTLQGDFASSRSAFAATTATLRSQAKTTIATARTACRAARAAKDRAACRAAVKQARLSLRDLRVQLRTAVKARRAALQASRRTFWTAIRSLAGGRTIAPDTADGPDPAPSLPDGGALAAL